MDTKRVALVAVFAALTIVLSPDISRISIPSPFFGLPYQVWEIPIFVAFLLLGSKPGFLIFGVGSLVLVAFRPDPIAVGGVLACFSMLGGFYLAHRLVTRSVPEGTTPSTRKTIIATTAGGIIFRTGVMAVQNYFTLPLYLSVLGRDNSPSLLISFYMPMVAAFNITEPLYVIPLSYLIAKAIRSNLRIGNKL
jgi:riboflavin transporter FmnP